MKAFIVLVGFLLAAIGWGVGGSHFSATDHGHSADCGTARDPGWGNAAQNDALNHIATGVSSDLESVCQSKADTRMMISWGLIIVGGITAVGGIVYAATNRVK